MRRIRKRKRPQVFYVVSNVRDVNKYVLFRTLDRVRSYLCRFDGEIFDVEKICIRKYKPMKVRVAFLTSSRKIVLPRSGSN